MPTTTDPIDRSDCPKKTGKHGTTGAYKLGCRCSDALVVKLRYEKRRAAGMQPEAMISGVGLARRLQALAALGHPDTVVGPAMGLRGKHGGVSWYRCRPEAKFHRDTFAAAVRAYDLLSAVPGTSPVTRSRALARGYAPPLAWEGVDIDDPAAVPDFGERTPDRRDVAELVLVYREGRTLDELAVSTGLKQSTLITYLQNAGVTIRERSRLDGRERTGRAA